MVGLRCHKSISKKDLVYPINTTKQYVSSQIVRNVIVELVGRRICQ